MHKLLTLNFTYMLENRNSLMYVCMQKYTSSFYTVRVKCPTVFLGAYDSEMDHIDFSDVSPWGHNMTK